MTIANESGGDTRPAMGGWAPGSYECFCLACLRSFIGDKRASICAPCAYAGVRAADDDTPPHIADAIPQGDGAREGDVDAKAAIYRAMVAMGLGSDPDDGPTGRWPCGTHVIDALIAERDKLKSERDAALGRYADAVLGVDRLKAECAGLRALLSVARDSVEFEVQEKRQNWGDRLMHKQQGAIDLLAKITAAITPTPAAERGGSEP